MNSNVPLNKSDLDSRPRRSMLATSLAAFLGVGTVVTTGMTRSCTAASGEVQPYSVGYRTLKIEAVGPDGRMTRVSVAVWYPSSETPATYSYRLGDNTVQTDVAHNGRIAAGKFPLVVYSHGATGCGLSTAFLTERLAGQGFIVAAPDHTDEYVAARIDPATLPRQSRLYKFRMLRFITDVKDHQLNSAAMEYRTRLAYRPKQVVATLDAMLAPHAPFPNSINTEAIGLVGHSFGAWTSMLVGGIDPRYKDPRVKAVVALSGPVNPNIYQGSELAGLKVPVMLMYGTVEVMQGRGDDRGLFYNRMPAPKFLLGIKGADHFTFSGGVRFEFPRMRDYVDRDASRRQIVEYAEAFLKYYLQHDPKAKALLEKPTDNYLFDLGAT